MLVETQTLTSNFEVRNLDYNFWVSLKFHCDNKQCQLIRARAVSYNVKINPNTIITGMREICGADSLGENMTEEKILRKKSWDTTSHVCNKIKSKTMKI